MKRFALLFLFLFIFVVFSFPQNSKIISPNIAFVSYYAFEDDKGGIEKLSKAMLLLNEEGMIGQHILIDLYKQREQKITELGNKNLTESQKTDINNSLSEINERIKEIVTQRKEVYERRKKVLIQPILDEIEKVLAEIAQQNNLIILDIGQLADDGVLLAIDENIDITKLLVPVLNDYFQTKITPTLKVNLPENKVGIINTESFYDESDGITQLVKIEKEFKSKIKLELGDNPTKEQVESWQKRNIKYPNRKIFTDIGKALDKFSHENGFTLIIDSSDEIPTQIKKFPSRDITKDFISYYNQKNQ